jgi:hypothetical protein
MMKAVLPVLTVVTATAAIVAIAMLVMMVAAVYVGPKPLEVRPKADLRFSKYSASRCDDPATRTAVFIMDPCLSVLPAADQQAPTPDVR